MNSAVTTGYYDRMAGDPELVSKLASYRGKPAIFTTRFVPDDFEANGGGVYIRTDGMESVTRNLDLSGRPLIEMVRLIELYADDTGDPTLIEDAAERVAEIFEQGLAIQGHEVFGVVVSGPTRADPDQETFGRVVSTTVLLAEE